MIWFLYILECKDSSLYTGITNNLEKRLSAHNQGIGAKYTRGRGPFTIVYTEEYLEKGSALRREIEIKKLSRREKLRLSLRV